MKKFISQITAGILGLWLGVKFISEIELEIIPGESSFLGIPFTANWQILILIGFALGLINFFIKPILKTISLPLRILTLGFFSLVINMGLIWFVDLLFKELTVPWFWPIFWLTIIIWALNLILLGLAQKRRVIK